MTRKIVWLPRVLSWLLALFVSLFALDVFGEPRWLSALLIHLIPSYFLIGAALVAWKNESLGGVLYVLLGIWLLFFTNFQGWIFAIPVFVIGLLFLIIRRL